MSKAEVKWRPSFRCSDFFHRQHSYGKTKGFLQQHSRIWPITLVSSKASRNGGTFLFPDRNQSPYVLKTVNILVMASWSLAFWVWGISSPPAGQSVSEAHLQSLSFHFSGPLKDSIRIYFPVLGFLYHWLSDKEPTCQAGDTGSIPGSGRSPGEGNGNPLQYSCLGNPMDRGAWQATVYRVTKSQTQLSD